MIDKLAEVLRTTCRDWDGNGSHWATLAEAAVDELIDRPEREFQAQLAAVVARNEEADSVGSWAPEARVGPHSD